MKTYIIVVIIAVFSFSAAWLLQEKKWSLHLEAREAFEKERMKKSGAWTDRQIRPLLEAMEHAGRISTTLTVTEHQGNELKEETKAYIISQLGAYRSEIIVSIDDPIESDLFTYLQRSEVQSLHELYQLHPSDQIEIIDSYLTKLGVDPNQFTAKKRR